MKKFLIFAISIILTMFTCACNKERSHILFNNHPFTKDTIFSGSNIFKPGDRVYYLITLPTPVETRRLYIQIVKVDGDTDERLGYNLVWAKRIKLKDEQIYYYTDYVVFNQTGVYLMKVYSRDNPTKILTTSQFYVKN